MNSSQLGEGVCQGETAVDRRLLETVIIGMR